MPSTLAQLSRRLRSSSTTRIRMLALAAGSIARSSDTPRSRLLGPEVRVEVAGVRIGVVPIVLVALGVPLTMPARRYPRCRDRADGGGRRHRPRESARSGSASEYQRYMLLSRYATASGDPRCGGDATWGKGRGLRGPGRNAVPPLHE